MQRHDLLTERQAQPRAASLLHDRRFDLHVLSEQLLLVILGDSRPLVFHGDGYHSNIGTITCIFLHFGCRDGDHSAVRGELNGIAEQISQHVFNAEAVANDAERDVMSEVRAQAERLGNSSAAECGKDLRYGVCQRERVHL